MVYLNRIYTRSGDAGETSLGEGQRVAKISPRITAIGSVDELNASLGVVQAASSPPGQLADVLARLQNDLFDLGADLCVPVQPANAERQPLRMKGSDVERLEQLIDRFNADLPPLTSFVLPGGTSAAAFLHQARTVCRRAELDVLRLAAAEEVNGVDAMYLNRLSDLLFVLARYCNQQAGAGDVLWRPGGEAAGPPR